MNKQNICILIFAFCTLFSKNSLSAQEDSLLNVLQNARTNPDKFAALIGLCNHFIIEDPNLEKSELYTQKLMALAREVKDSLQLSRALFYQGNILRDQNRIKEAIKVLESCLSIQKKINSYSSAAATLSNLGNLYYETGDVGKTYEAYIEGVNLTKRCDCPDPKRALSLALAWFYSEIAGDYTEAVNWGKTAYQHALIAKQTDGQCLSLFNIGSSYLDLNKIDSALYYTDLAYECATTEQVDWIQCLVLANKAEIEINEKQFDLALRHAKEAYQISLQLPEEDIKMLVQVPLGDAYYHTKDYENARKYLNNAKQIALGNKSMKYRLPDIYQLLADIEAKENPALAINYLKLRADVKDSLNRELLDNRVAIFSVQSNVALKESENKRLQSDIEKQTQKTRFIEILMLGVLAILALFIFFYKQIRSKNIALKNLNKLADEQNLSLSQSTRQMELFTKTLSHDALSYINHILNFATIANESSDIQNTKQFIHKIHAIASDLKRMSENLINYNKSRQAQNKVNIDLTELARQEFDDIVKESNNKDARLIISNLPVIHSDREFVRQVFRNLISNAAKYQQPDIPLILDIDYVQQEGFIEIRVKDNGIGISAENLKNIFGEFYKIDNSIDGSGLGLYISKQLLLSLGGEIWAESQTGIGTTLYFTLPYP